MEARRYLEQVGKIDRLIANKLIEIAQWRSIASGTSSSAEGERVQSSGAKDKMADAICRVVEIENEANELIKKLISTKQEVTNTIEKLDAESYDIIHKRYIQGKDLLEISNDYNKTVASVKRKQGKALKQVQHILDEREKK